MIEETTEVDVKIGSNLRRSNKILTGGGIIPCLEIEMCLLLQKGDC